MIQVRYRATAEDAPTFTGLMRELAAARRRNGGYGWTLMQDAADPDAHVEIRCDWSTCAITNWCWKRTAGYSNVSTRFNPATLRPRCRNYLRLNRHASEADKEGVTK